MLTGREGREELPRGVGSHAGTQELIRLDGHRHRDQELTAQPGDELGRDPMGLVTPVRSREQRPGVGNDLQRAVTSLLR